jgi:hypothetical protein
MITSKKCRVYATESALIGRADVATPHSIHHAAMAIKWTALAVQMDADDVKTASAAFGQGN